MQVAQVAAVAGTLALLARDARRAGARERALAVALLLLVPACFGPIVAIRGQLFSLPLFAACALLLRSEARRRRAASGCSSRCSRCGATCTARCSPARPSPAPTSCSSADARARSRAPPSALASALALCANPALWNTPDYVLGVLHNEAARQAIGLWAPLSPRSWLDVAFVLAAVRAARRRAALTAEAVGDRRARGPGAADAARRARRHVARALRRPARRGRLRRRVRTERLPRLARPVALALVVVVLLGVAHGPLPSGASQPVLHRTLTLARGTPVLAEDLLAEQVADAGRSRLGLESDRRLPPVRPADLRRLAAWPARPGDAALAHAPRAVLVRLRRQGRPPPARRPGLPPRGLRSALRAVRARRRA